MEFLEENAKKLDLDNLCWIYFLVDRDEVIYIGKTTHGAKRPLSHKDKIFDKVYYIECLEEELDYLENEQILRYKPKYNKQLNLKTAISFSNIAQSIKDEFNIKRYSPLMLYRDIEYWGISDNVCEFNGVQYLMIDDFYGLMRNFKRLKGLE